MAQETAAKQEADRSAWRLYGIVSGFTGAVCAAAFSYAMYHKGGGDLWLAGAVVMGLGAAGSVYGLFNEVAAQTRREPLAKSQEKFTMLPKVPAPAVPQ